MVTSERPPRRVAPEGDGLPDGGGSKGSFSGGSKLMMLGVPILAAVVISLGAVGSNMVGVSKATFDSNFKSVGDAIEKQATANTNVQKQITDAVNLANTAGGKADSANAQLSSLTQKITDAQMKATDASTKVSGMATQTGVDALKAQIATLQTDLTATKGELASTKTGLTTAVEKIAALEIQLDGVIAGTTATETTTGGTVSTLNGITASIVSPSLTIPPTTLSTPLNITLSNTGTKAVFGEQLLLRLDFLAGTIPTGLLINGGAVPFSTLQQPNAITCVIGSTSYLAPGNTTTLTITVSASTSVSFNGTVSITGVTSF